MRPTVYGVVRQTEEAASRIRGEGNALSPAINGTLTRLEAAVRRALASSPDGETIARAEKLVALDAFCDLHVALEDQPEDVRARFRPILDAWVADGAMRAVTLGELERRAGRTASSDLESWFDTGEP